MNYFEKKRKRLMQGTYLQYLQHISYFSFWEMLCWLFSRLIRKQTMEPIRLRLKIMLFPVETRSQSERPLSVDWSSWQGNQTTGYTSLSVNILKTFLAALALHQETIRITQGTMETMAIS